MGAALVLFALLAFCREGAAPPPPPVSPVSPPSAASNVPPAASLPKPPVREDCEPVVASDGPWRLATVSTAKSPCTDVYVSVHDECIIEGSALLLRG